MATVTRAEKALGFHQEPEENETKSEQEIALSQQRQTAGRAQ